MSELDNETSISAAVAFCDPATPYEQMAETLQRLNNYMERAKQLKKDFEAVLTEWISVNGPIEIGTIKYWIGHDKKVKCVDMPRSLALLLEISGGDFDHLCSFLSVNAIKPGAARAAMLPEDFKLFFEETVNDKLESGEKLPKRLQSADKRFIENG